MDFKMKLKSINPATLEVISEIETTPVDEVFEISVRAREAFKKWSNTTIDERLKLLKNAISFPQARRHQIRI